MDQKTRKTLGSIAAGCGCLSLLALSAWLAFVIYIGIQGRGNDEEVSLIIGSVTCCVSVPVLAITIAGFVFALRSGAPNTGSTPPEDES